MVLLNQQLLFCLFTLAWVMVALFLNRVTYTDPKLLEAAISSKHIYFWRMFLVFMPSALVRLIIRAYV